MDYCEWITPYSFQMQLELWLVQVRIIPSFSFNSFFKKKMMYLFIITGCIGMYQSVATVVPTKLYTFSAFVIAFATYTFMKGNYKLLGSFGCALAVILSGSPLVTLATVVRDKSTASLPFATSFTTWCNAFSWASYGLLVAHDPMVPTSNYY